MVLTVLTSCAQEREKQIAQPSQWHVTCIISMLSYWKYSYRTWSSSPPISASEIAQLIKIISILLNMDGKLRNYNWKFKNWNLFMYFSCHLVVRLLSSAVLTFSLACTHSCLYFVCSFLFCFVFTYYEIPVRVNEFYTFRSRKHLLPTSSTKDHRGAHACLWHNPFFLFKLNRNWIWP